MSPQATFCATLVDEWVRAGVRHAVVSPGSRSTPLALALVARNDLAVHVVLDERSAAFVALGIGKASGSPAVLLCTSGTAAANHLPAVVEAGLSGVPLLVCTADRPPDLHEVGAPQTVRQVGLLGRSPRWEADLDPLAVPPSAWRSLASRARIEAAAGPVHLNLRFREPLVAEPGGLPVERVGGGPWHDAAVAERRWEPDDDVLARLDGKRLLVVAGGGADEGGAAWLARSPWPVLADPVSGLRRALPAVVCAGDAIARFADRLPGLVPEVVLHLGAPPASKVLGQWLRDLDAVHVVAGGDDGRWTDPDRTAAVHLTASPASVASALASLTTPPADLLDEWVGAERIAQAVLGAVLDGDGALTEPAVARTITRVLGDGDRLLVSSSMPVRDVEWFGVSTTAQVLANRGANGIDGVPSTALGIALADPARHTVCLLGDLALLHDGSGLTGLAQRSCSLTLVVVDNGGGGIFSFLPQAESLPGDRFEQLFGTPQSTDIAALCGAHGLPIQTVGDVAGLERALVAAREAGGVRVVLVRTERGGNVVVHQALNAAVAEAVLGDAG